MIDGAKIGVIMIVSFILSAFVSFLVPYLLLLVLLKCSLLKIDLFFLTRVSRTALNDLSLAWTYNLRCSTAIIMLNIIACACINE